MTTSPTQGEHAQPEAPYLQLADLLASGQHLVSVERKETADAIRTLHAQVAALTAAPGVQTEHSAIEDMRNAVRFAAGSAYWSAELVRFFGPNARDGINALEQQLRDALAQVRDLEAALSAQPAAPQGGAYAELIHELEVIASTTLHATIEGSRKSCERDVVLKAIEVIRASHGQAPARAASEAESRCANCGKPASESREVIADYPEEGEWFCSAQCKDQHAELDCPHLTHNGYRHPAESERLIACEAVLRSLASWLGAGGYNALTVDAKVFEEKIRWGVEHLLQSNPTAQPAPAATPQADRQPAPVQDYPPLPEPDLGMPWRVNAKSDGAAHSSGFTYDQMRAYVDADRAARTPADSVTAPEGGVDDDVDAVALARYKVVPAHESMFHRFAVVAGDGKQQLYLGREIECANMARKFAGAFLDGAFYQASIAPTPPAQAADSVLEDAAREAIDKVLALFPFNAPIQTFTIGGGPCLTADGDTEFYSAKRIWALLRELKTTLAAARKQGANHD